MEDKNGRRFYGFFSTHLECERVIQDLGAGLGKTDKGLSFPGWIPNWVESTSQIPGWDSIEEGIQKRFERVLRSKKKEPHIEYRYYDRDTKQRSAFRATVSFVKDLAVSP